MKIIRERKVVSGVSYTLRFDWSGEKNWGYAFECDERGLVDISSLCPEAILSLQACRTGVIHGKPIGPARVDSYRYRHVEPAIAECDVCKGEAEFHSHCGCFVCGKCDQHLGLARCYCKWAASGGNGREELVEMGETIDDDY